MKVLITEDTLDSLLSIKISSDGGKTYTDYEVSSLKNGGLTLDCNPSDLKVICDTNILNYIKVFADGEKLNTGSGGGSSQTTIQELSVTENGTYNAGSNAAYNPVIVNVPSGVGDKLLCYAKYRSRGYTCTIYTDKPATQLNVSISQYESVILPQDDGKHLFITNLDLMNKDNLDYINLIYEDGSSIDLKGKVIEATQDA